MVAAAPPQTAAAGRRRRFPSWVYRHGDEADPRFSLANERTFLAWIRTSLALLAAGVALEALALPLEPRLALAASVLLLALALLVPLSAWWHWARTELAMRRGEPLRASAPTVALALGLSVDAALVLVAILVGP